MSSIPSNTELVSILEHRMINIDLLTKSELVLPETNHGVSTNVGSFLFQFPEQLLSDLTRQLGHPLDLSSNHTLEASPDVAEDVPALNLAGYDQPLVLHGLHHAGLVGCVDLNCLYLCLRCHD